MFQEHKISKSANVIVDKLFPKESPLFWEHINNKIYTQMEVSVYGTKKGSTIIYRPYQVSLNTF